MIDIHDRKFCVAPMIEFYNSTIKYIEYCKSFLFTEIFFTKSMIYSKNKDLIIENDDRIIL